MIWCALLRALRWWRWCPCPLTGYLTSSTCVYGCVVNDVSAIWQQQYCQPIISDWCTLCRGPCGKQVRAEPPAMVAIPLLLQNQPYPLSLKLLPTPPPFLAVTTSAHCFPFLHCTRASYTAPERNYTVRSITHICGSPVIFRSYHWAQRAVSLLRARLKHAV